MAKMAAETFNRPRWMVHTNLAAGLLFAVLGLLHLATERFLFGIVWLVIAGFWLVRYRWALTSPFLEVAEGSLVVHLGPGRQRALALADVTGVTAEGSGVKLQLGDGSTLSLSASDLAPGEMPRLIASLEAVKS